MTHAIIIGAGVAGPVLSMALDRVGIRSTIFERDAVTARHRGAWLTLQANGIDALRAIDAAGPIEELGNEVETIGFINGKGKSLGKIPLAAPRKDGLVSRMMRRADLYEALWKSAQDRGAQFAYGREFVGVSHLSDGRIEARFADGTTAVGDLLVGCDGIHSRVRQIIDPNARKPRYVPVLNVGGYIPNFTVDVPSKQFRMQFGTRCFFAWMPTPDGGTVWFANPPMSTEPERGELSGMSDYDWRRWLHELMQGDTGPSHQIIDAAPGPMVGWATYDLPVVRRWQARQMIVIGDAAHATSPASGQGASMALEDAVILAQCLRDRPQTSDAFALFETLRRNRVEQIVKHGARSSNSKAAGPIGRVIRDFLLPIVLKQLAKNNGAAMSWLQGHHIEFECMVRKPSERT